MLGEIDFLQGEKAFTTALNADEGLNMDYVYDSLDLFQNASKVAFAQHDIELEARCEAKLGKIYDKVLKKQVKAMIHFNSVMRLANSLKPRNVT